MKTTQAANRNLSPTVAKIVKVLAAPDGATRAQIIKRVPTAKPGYISALLYRILPAKGLKVRRKRADGEVRYRVAA